MDQKMDLQVARSDLMATFWYLTIYLKNTESKATAEEKLAHVLEVAETILGRHGGIPEGWPQTWSEGAP
jgi:hypothetical protein